MTRPDMYLNKGLYVEKSIKKAHVFEFCTDVKKY